MLDFTRQLIWQRRNNRALRRLNFFSGKGDPADLAWLDVDGSEFTEAHWQNTTQHRFAMYLDGDQGTTLLVLLNATTEVATFTLPPTRYGSTWQRIIDTAAETPVQGTWLDGAGDQIEVLGQSMVLFLLHHR